MYRRALLCYDGSRQSRDALRHGGELVAALKCETHIVVVSNVRDEAAAYAAVVPGMLQSGHAACDTVLQEAREWLRQRGVEAAPHIEIGWAIDVIPRLARELDVDLIVLGYVPRTRFARWWAGPGSALLLDRVHCSVLVAFG